MTQVALLSVFFGSGVAALLYQTIWQRMLALFGGADVHAATIIVAAFMAGLGFGGLAGGHLADRLSPRGRLWTFAACEAAVSVFALFSATLYYDTLYIDAGDLELSRLALGAITFGVTLVPTFLMGMSLPIMASFPAWSRDTPATWVSQLYGWNTMGAALGSLVAVTVLFQSFDLRVNLQIGAAINAGCGLAALALSGAKAAGAAPISAAASRSGPASAPTLALRTWLVLYALSGFIALSLEIVWLRLLGVMLKSSAMTFGYLLAVYLGGLGLGSLLAHGQIFRRVDATRTFLRLQAAVPLWAGCAIGLLVLSINHFGHLGVLSSLRAAMASPTPVTAPEMIQLTYGLLPFLLIVPSTVMMGLSFGLLQRAVQTDVALVGRRVGWLQAANILGATLGAAVTGVLLLDALGSAGTLRALVACSVVFLLVLPDTRRTFMRMGRLAVVAGVVVLLPGESSLWAALHGSRSQDVIVGEDASGLIVYRQDPDQMRVFLGGISQSWLPYGGVHTALGALPALLHPMPEDIALIGLASGDTLFAIGARDATRKIESLEIMAPQLPTLKRVAQLGTYPAIPLLLNDTRVRHHTVDGRVYLRRARGRFDIVEADPLLPRSASAGNLYSVEYFRVLAGALKPGGFAVTWLPTMRTLDTFASVFPHVLRFGDVGIGSPSPIVYDRDVLLDRMNSPRTRAYFERGGIDLAAVLAPYLAAAPQVPRRPTVTHGLNRDLFPMDEFGTPYRSPQTR